MNSLFKKLFILPLLFMAVSIPKLHAEFVTVGIVLPTVSQVIFATAFGVLAVSLFLRSGTLWIPIFVHGVGNIVTYTFFALISRERIFHFAQTPIEMSISEFFTSTLMSTIPLLVIGLFLLRKVKPEEVTGEVPEHSCALHRK